MVLDLGTDNMAGCQSEDLPECDCDVTRQDKLENLCLSCLHNNTPIVLSSCKANFSHALQIDYVVFLSRIIYVESYSIKIRMF